MLMAVMLMHAIAITAIWLAALTRYWQIGGTLILVVSAIYYFRQLRRVTVAAIEADESGYRVFYHGKWLDVQLWQAFITVPLTVIQFKPAIGRRIAIPLLADSLSADDYRHLRVWLRWVRYGDEA